MQHPLMWQQQRRQLKLPADRGVRCLSRETRLLASRLSYSRALLINQQPLMQLKEDGERLQPQALHSISLPDTSLPLLSLQHCLHHRHSSRQYGKSALPLPQLAALLQHAAGIRQHHNPASQGRTYPSGGAMYPIRLYLWAQRVDSLTPALYRYEPDSHQLSLISLQTTALTTQPFHPDTALLLLLVNDWTAQSRKYGDVSYKLAQLEAGHLAQNLTLAATALSLCSIPLQFYFEHEINRQLGLTPSQASVCYAIEVGTNAAHLPKE
jgi:SagB-type dehydrogenase family enzyme